MPKIVILPHQDLCPDGAVLEANSGETIPTQLCVTVSRLNTPVKNPVLAPPATASFVKVLTHCRKAQSRKTTCWTKPGDWSRKAV
ncbi:ferredoxin [Escherichia coli]|uniref:Ferredoxin n=1 Tax=Escherichia coli TaxID=562 RepID=A0A377AHK2_ECOLX|nr:ferredoxin [Escherichia coli]